MIDPDDLVNLTTAAARAGMKRPLLGYYATQEGFPAVQGDPAATGGKLYLWTEISAWLDSNAPTR